MALCLLVGALLLSLATTSPPVWTHSVIRDAGIDQASFIQSRRRSRKHKHRQHRAHSEADPAAEAEDDSVFPYSTAKDESCGICMHLVQKVSVYFMQLSGQVAVAGTPVSEAVVTVPRGAALKSAWQPQTPILPLATKEPVADTVVAGGIRRLLETPSTDETTTATAATSSTDDSSTTETASTDARSTTITAAVETSNTDYGTTTAAAVEAAYLAQVSRAPAHPSSLLERRARREVPAKNAATLASGILVPAGQPMKTVADRLPYEAMGGASATVSTAGSREARRYRVADALAVRPAQARWSLLGPQTPSRASELKRAQNRLLEDAAYRMLAGFCTFRVPPQYTAYCDNVLQNFPIVLESIHYADRPDQVCGRIDACPKGSYIFQNVHARGWIPKNKTST